jgi:Tol biopolymer transport system component
VRRLLAAALFLAAAGAAAWWVARARSAVPAGAAGAIAFVSTREGEPAVYWRRLPRGRARRLTAPGEPAEHPAISPDGTRVAFTSRGRLAVAAVASGDVRFVTYAVDWKDAEPAWLPDGQRLVVSARRREGEPAGLHLLDPGERGALERHPLTRPVAGGDTSPAVAPDGAWVLFVRQGHLMRVDLADGRVRRLTGGFRLERSPRFLPSGRIVCAWSEGKVHGIDTLEPDGRSRATLAQGPRSYATLAPSPDGRFLAATLAFDMARSPLSTLLGAQREELHLLDAEARPVAALEASGRHANHSADWGR